MCSRSSSSGFRCVERAGAVVVKRTRAGFNDLRYYDDWLLSGGKGAAGAGNAAGVAMATAPFSNESRAPTESTNDNNRRKYQGCGSCCCAQFLGRYRITHRLLNGYTFRPQTYANITQLYGHHSLDGVFFSLVLFF